MKHVTPASKTFAMFAWSIIASACCSTSKRAITCLVSIPSLMKGVHRSPHLRLGGGGGKLPMTFSAKPNPVSEIVQATGTDDKTAQMEPIEGRSESVSSAQAETGVSLAGTGEQNESIPSRQPPQNSGDRWRRAGTGGNGGKERAMGLEPTTASLEGWKRAILKVAKTKCLPYRARALVLTLVPETPTSTSARPLTPISVKRSR